VLAGGDSRRPDPDPRHFTDPLRRDGAATPGMRRQQGAGRNRESGGRFTDGRRRTRRRHRARGHRQPPRRRTNDRDRPIDRRSRGRSRLSRRSGRGGPRRRRSGGGRRRRAVQIAATAIVAVGASIPPVARLAALTAAGFGDAGSLPGTAGESDGLAAAIGSVVADPTATEPVWSIGGEWTLLAAALLVFGGWVASVATAVRVAARIAALRA